jgi:hypothetical protein
MSMLSHLQVFCVWLLQMAFPNLRSDNSLIAFNRRLQELGWDLPVSMLCGLL